MMVGPSGSGKSSAWRILLKALENVEGVEGVAHVVDPKVCFQITSCGDMFVTLHALYSFVEISVICTTAED